MSDSLKAGEDLIKERKAKGLSVNPKNSLPKDLAGFKYMCCAFFRYWWNEPGNNTEQGFDEWYKKWDGYSKALEDSEPTKQKGK